MAKFNLFQKVWQAHSVGQLANGQTQLFVGAISFMKLPVHRPSECFAKKPSVRYPERTFATVDHIVLRTKFQNHTPTLSQMR